MAGKEHLIDAVAKLRWGSTSEWSTALKPDECRALLAVIPEHELTIKTLAAKDSPTILSGDPGDEQPE